MNEWKNVSHVGDEADIQFSKTLERLMPSHAPTLNEVDENLHDEGGRPKALIGNGSHGNVWFDPDLPDMRLSNEHLAITGESGSGKTQILKNILAELSIPALVLDFKDDYAEDAYAQKEGFTVYDPTKQSLPFNPLAPPIDPKTGEANTTFHTYQLAEIIRRIYGLGDLQGYGLRQAIKGVYDEAGIPAAPFKPDAATVFPAFQNVKDKLQQDKGNNELLGHMSPMFDFGFFSSTDAHGFGDIVNGNTVIRLAQLPGNEVKNSIAEFFLMALYNYLIRQPQSHALSRVLVLDEAWRLVNSPFLEPLMREARAFGLGIFVATQFPTDLPLAVSGSTATKMFFSQSAPREVAEVQRIVFGKSSEGEYLSGVVRSLAPMHCVFVNKQYSPYVTVDAHPYFKRDTSPELAGGLPQAEGLQATANLNLTKHAQNDGRATYVCTRCNASTDNTSKVCNDCAADVDVNDFTNGDTSGYDIETAQGAPNFPWQRAAELVSLTDEDEDEGPFDQFSTSEWQMVKGPKRRA